MEDTKDYTVTMFGISALQMPTIVSIAPKESILSNLQALGFPFDMSKKFMKDHFAFSPGNILSGRYYTLFTSVYNHTDLQHLLQNMVVLTAVGQPVHKKVGRRHFLAIFTGGGFVGNLGMWVYYLMQRSIFTSAAQDMQLLPSSVNNIIIKICEDECPNTSTKLIIDPNILNYGISCYGSSAGVNAILSFGACCSAERIVSRLQECRGQNLKLDIPLFVDMMNIVFTIRLFSNDVVGLVTSFLTENGFFDELIAKTGIIIGYAAHVTGTLFGLVYYYCMYRRNLLV